MFFRLVFLVFVVKGNLCMSVRCRSHPTEVTDNEGLWNLMRDASSFMERESPDDVDDMMSGGHRCCSCLSEAAQGFNQTAMTRAGQVAFTWSRTIETLVAIYLLVLRYDRSRLAETGLLRTLNAVETLMRCDIANGDIAVEQDFMFSLC
eukprot:GHVS01034207.1.p1 GENE.GHVS01034207.1~~GHVS01034207.1.p1  ORF type:complete len:149 (-),score=10.77 GHVS01034207.1:238-684(-)